tara:strand:+ start:490 stop:678 length:189 start_codon:yes stop_codon:yes gene_type:complete
MFEKNEILIIAFFIFVIFYSVISLGASKRKKEQSGEIKSYLFGVRILILIIAVVFLILWFFL